MGKSFAERGQEFLREFDLLQKKLKVSARPVITEYGPDLRLIDLETKEAYEDTTSK